MFSTTCTNCGAVIEVPLHYKDKIVRCVSCGSDFRASNQLSVPEPVKAKSGNGRMYAILLAAGAVLLGGAAIAYYVQKAEQRHRVAMEREQQRAAELEEKIALLQQQSEDEDKRKQWDMLIDKIILILNRASRESINYRPLGGISAEETRQLSLLNERESEANMIVLELKSQGFPEHEKLKKLIRSFQFAHSNHVTDSLSGDISEAIKSSIECTKILQSITELKSESK